MMATQQEAEASAAELCDRLGNGWTPRVWDNFGWHWSAQKGDAEVYGHRDHYSAWIHFTVREDDRGRHTSAFIANAPDPVDALGYATQIARTHVSRIEETLRALSD